MEIRLSAHGAYHHQYHIVWIPKYRKKILKGELKKFIETRLFEIHDYHPEVEVDTHGLTPVALAAEDHFISFEGFRTLKLPRKERFHLRAHARSPQLILDREVQCSGRSYTFGYYHTTQIFGIKYRREDKSQYEQRNPITF